jgi:hypothetical protein
MSCTERDADAGSGRGGHRGFAQTVGPRSAVSAGAAPSLRPSAGQRGRCCPKLGRGRTPARRGDPRMQVVLGHDFAQIFRSCSINATSSNQMRGPRSQGKPYLSPTLGEEIPADAT